YNQRIDERALVGLDVRDDDVLVCGDAEVAAVDFRDLAQTRELRTSRAVGHPTGLDAQRQVPATVVTLGPAETIAVRRELERPRGLEHEALALRDLGNEGRQAHRIDRV